MGVYCIFHCRKRMFVCHGWSWLSFHAWETTRWYLVPAPTSSGSSQPSPLKTNDYDSWRNPIGPSVSVGGFWLVQQVCIPGGTGIEPDIYSHIVWVCEGILSQVGAARDYFWQTWQCCGGFWNCPGLWGLLGLVLMMVQEMLLSSKTWLIIMLMFYWW